MNQIHLSNLPGYAKLFVAVFTTLMLFVCAWAVVILYVEEGMLSEEPDEASIYGRIAELVAPLDETENDHEQLEHNIGLAHTHINGQTLLFFAMGFVFLFTSATPRVKKNTLWVFGGAVLLHAIGLSGMDYHWFFDDALAISGVAILIVIPYMAFRIYADLARKPVFSEDGDG